jgi:hypothetical protein
MIRLTILTLALAALANSQVVLLRIQVVEGEGVVHPAGARSAHPIVVSVTDEANRPVAGAAVSFHLPEDGPGGTFASGLRTNVEITDARGRCVVRGFQANRVPGRFQIRIIATKEQARAGTVSFQYVGELQGRSGAKTTGSKSNRKWIAIAAVAGGGAAAGILASHKGSQTPTASPATPPVPVLTIGVPSISVGKP